MILGLTGMIGSGKTAAAEILKSLGAVVVDADQIGREVVENDSRVLHRLIRQFGEQILTPSGKLNRTKLAWLAFADEAARKQLNTVVHPPLLRRLKAEVHRLSKEHDLVVVDAALLLEWSLDRVVDYVIVVHASQELRLSRLEARGMERKDAIQRQKRQFSYTQFRKRADFIVFNRGTRHQLETKIKELLKSLV